MSRFSRVRLLALASIEYRPDAWRNQQDVDDLLSQFHHEFRQLSDEYGRWIPYTMPAVEVVREALQDDIIDLDDVPQIIEDVYLRALDRNYARVTRGMMRRAINHAVYLAGN